MKTYQNPPVALPITQAELLALGVPQTAIDAGEMRGEITHVGPWHLIRTFRALCVSSVFNERGIFPQTLSTAVYGMRALSKPRESGYALEARDTITA